MMTTEYVKCLEYFCATKLDCYVEDLEELPKFFSKLAESVNFKLYKDSDDLGKILYYLYKNIANRIVEGIYNICEDNKIIEYVDLKTNDVKEYKVEGDLASDLLKISEEIVNADPFILSASEGTSFDSILDKTIDFDSDVETNVDYLIKYILKNKLVRVGEEYKEED